MKVSTSSIHLVLKWLLEPRMGDGNLKGDNIKIMLLFNLLEVVLERCFVSCEILDLQIPRRFGINYVAKFAYVFHFYLWTYMQSSTLLEGVCI